MNANPPVNAPSAPPSNNADAAYAKKAELARGGNKMNEKLTAVGAIAQAIGLEVLLHREQRLHQLDRRFLTCLESRLRIQPIRHQLRRTPLQAMVLALKAQP